VALGVLDDLDDLEALGAFDAGLVSVVADGADGADVADVADGADGADGADVATGDAAAAFLPRCALTLEDSGTFGATTVDELVVVSEQDRAITAANSVL